MTPELTAGLIPVSGGRYRNVFFIVAACIAT